MIRTLTTPIEERYRLPTQRSPGRYEGLVNFAYKLGGLFGSQLKEWTVLDVGGADGWLGEILVCRRYWWVDPKAVWTIWGADPLVARRLYGPCCATAEKLPYQSECMDLVISKQTLPHFSDPALACREMLRVARHAVVIRQEFPESPIGWPGHSRSQIDAPMDILQVLTVGASKPTYDGTDFVARREP